MHPPHMTGMYLVTSLVPAGSSGGGRSVIASSHCGKAF